MLRNLMSFDRTVSPYDGTPGQYGTANLVQTFFGGGYYTIGGNISIVTGAGALSPHFPGARTGTGALGMSGGGAADSASQLFDEQATWTIGFAFCTDIAVATDMLWISDGIPQVSGDVNPGVIQFGLAIGADNSIIAKYNAGSHSSAAGVFTTNKWTYIEIQSTCGASETITVRLNGVVLMTVTGVNTDIAGTGTANCVSFACTGAASDSVCVIYYDDVYILDGQDASGGSAVKTANNDFLGAVHVPCGFPTAPGYYSQFTPLANANWQEVNNINFSDSAYVATATASDKDTYGFPSTQADAVVFGVQLNIVARKDNAGPRVLAPLYRGEGTDYAQTAAEIGLSNTYETVQAEFDNDPATSETWTAAGVNAGQFGQVMES